jgi:hypothetical protein
MLPARKMLGPGISSALTRQHLVHMRDKRCGRRAAGVTPHGFREVDVAVPEAGDDGLARAIDHVRIGRNLDLTGASDGCDDAR